MLWSLVYGDERFKMAPDRIQMANGSEALSYVIGKGEDEERVAATFTVKRLTREDTEVRVKFPIHFPNFRGHLAKEEGTHLGSVMEERSQTTENRKKDECVTAIGNEEGEGVSNWCWGRLPCEWLGLAAVTKMREMTGGC
ncbi:hypothetical protein S245_061408 [Arachis hypogaea]